MTSIDRLLQTWRHRKGMNQLGANVRVIDVGAHQGELFDALGNRLALGFGVDPLVPKPIHALKYRVLPGLFPEVRPEEQEWDAIMMFAVLEHIPRNQQSALAAACYELLKDGGRVIITVPTKAVDSILSVLHALKLIHGMSLEEHFGFEIHETPQIFAPPFFKLVHHSRFQLGLNHLFVFEKQTAK